MFNHMVVNTSRGFKVSIIKVKHTSVIINILLRLASPLDILMKHHYLYIMLRKAIAMVIRMVVNCTSFFYFFI